MVHSSLSDLQIDTRQDEFPTTYRGNQDEFPTTYRVYSLPRYPPEWSQPARPPSADKEVFGLRKTTFWLSILAATLLVLGVVGTSVAGSIAASRKSSSDNVCKAENSAQAEPIITISPSASSLTSYVTTTLIQPSPIPSSPASAAPRQPALPIANCQNVQTPYAAKMSNVLFDISCETQNLGGDFMSFESSTLENCIDACANFNFWTVADNYSSSITCSTINFDSFLSWGGNCWLKESGHPQPAKSNQSVISASLREVFDK